jgi:site-specific recombinase XerD
MLQPNTRDPIGVSVRAMLELFYSTGIRRMEVINLTLAAEQAEEDSVDVAPEPAKLIAGI